MPNLGTLPIEKGFSDAIDLDFGEDVSAATIKVRTFASSGVPLFAEKTLVPVLGLPTKQRLTFTAADTSIPGRYYSEMDVLWTGVVNDPAHFTLSIEGKVMSSTASPITAIPQLIEVSPGGGADFTSVAVAIASITDASITTPYLIRRHPGNATEPPFAMKSWVDVAGVGSIFSVRLVAASNTQHFITAAPYCCLKNLTIQGPTSANCAAIDSQITGHGPFLMDDVAIASGYYGVWNHPSSYGLCHLRNVVNFYSGSQIQRFVHTTYYGVTTALGSSFMNGPAGAAVYGFSVEGPHAETTLDLCDVANDGIIALHIDNGGTIRARATTVHRATTALHLGPNGANSTFRGALSIDSDFVTSDIINESPTASGWIPSGTASLAQIHNTGLGQLTGSFSDLATNRQIIMGDGVVYAMSDGSSGPTQTWGAGNPVDSEPDGSEYRQTDDGGHVWLRQSGAWVLLR